MRTFRRTVSGALICLMLSGCFSFGFSGFRGFIGDFGAVGNFFVDLGTFVGVKSIDYLADVAYYSMEEGEIAEEYSPEQQYYIGRGVSAALLDTYGMADPDDQLIRQQLKYLNQMAGYINVSNPDGTALWAGVHVGILETMDAVAFATPGGFIWISKGALLMVQTEGELAALMCHELGHVAKEHAIDAYRTENGGNIKPNPWVRAADSAVLPVARNFGYAGGGIADSIRNGYGPKQELAADQWGIVALQLAGYSHKEMFRLLERVKAWEKKHPTEERYLKNHPEVDKRIEELRDFVSDNEEAFAFVVDPNSEKRQAARFKKLIH